MTLSMHGRPFDVSRRGTYLSASSPARPAARSSEPKRLIDPWAFQIEGQVADLKRRIPVLNRLIADCDRLAADLDGEVRNEEDRVKIHDPACLRSVAALQAKFVRDQLFCVENKRRASKL